jgi:hypothetical protein
MRSKPHLANRQNLHLRHARAVNETGSFLFDVLISLRRKLAHIYIAAPAPHGYMHAQ